MNRSHVTSLLRLEVGLCLCLAAGTSAVAFEKERPGRPEEGVSVPARFEFFISAEGEPEPGERYRIEVSADGFDTVLHSFDQLEDASGWAVSDPGDLAPSSEEDAWWRGVFYQPRETLPDGAYSWRASKHGGTGYERISGEVDFYVDTTPPAAVTEVVTVARPDGTLAFDWEPVVLDERGGEERVAGYRVYRYTTRNRFLPLTNRLIGETLETRFVDLYAPEDEEDLVFYQVTAVDEAGNEIGRRVPVKLGHTP